MNVLFGFVFSLLFAAAFWCVTLFCRVMRHPTRQISTDRAKDKFGPWRRIGQLSFAESNYREPAAPLVLDDGPAGGPCSLPPFSYGRHYCPKCGSWRGLFSTGIYNVGMWTTSEQAVMRRCYACEYVWCVRGKDATKR